MEMETKIPVRVWFMIHFKLSTFKGILNLWLVFSLVILIKSNECKLIFLASP